MSVKIYNVTRTNEVCNDYEVFVNGEKAELNTARVSAYPYNRRWPGKQRQLDQTELINFLSMEADEDFELRIVPKLPSLALRIRPRDLNIYARVSANGEIVMRVPKDAGQFTIEPYGRNHALHVFVDPISNYDIDKNSDDLLYFGAGEHDIGELYLKDNQTLFIDEGAVVYTTIFAMHVKNIKILGRGILDNSRNHAKVQYEANVENNDMAVHNAVREHCINILDCKNVEIDGITIRDSLVYNVDAMSSENVHINNVKIIGCWRFNSDGIHLSNCKNCSVTNSFVRTFDDSICIRGFANYEYERFLNDEKEEDLSFVCENILIKNCVVWNDWGKCLQVGTETFAKEIKNITFEGCKLIHLCGIGLAMWLVDNAHISSITFKDIVAENDPYMLKMCGQPNDDTIYTDVYDTDFGGLLVWCSINFHPEYSLIKSVEELGKIDGVTIENLNFYSLQKPSLTFAGFNSNSTIKDITLDNIRWNGERIPTALLNKFCARNEFGNYITFVEEE